jgi:hypothetical protein
MTHRLRDRKSNIQIGGQKVRNTVQIESKIYRLINRKSDKQIDREQVRQTD